MRTAIWCVLAFSAAAACAQQDSGSSYILRQKVQRVLEDVVVTDKAGNPVTDLKPGDLTLEEDGVTQKLLSFSLNDGREATYTPPEIPPLGPHTFVNVPMTEERGPLYVILYDMVNMDRNAQAMSRGPLARFIENAPPGVRIALFVNADGLRLVQGFTTDRALLLKAITTEGPGPHLPRMVIDGQNFGSGNVGATVYNFNRLSEYLSGLQGRKNLIWISSKFPLTVVAESLSEQSLGTDAVEGVRKTTASMARAEIAVYPVSADGVVLAGAIAHPQMNRTTDLDKTSAMGQGPNAPGGTSVGMNGESSANFQNASQDAALMAAAQGNIYTSYANMDMVAEATGGRSFQSNNDLTKLFREALNEGSTYYSLSYAPTNKAENDKARKITIVAHRPDLVLSYRKIYYMLPEDKLRMKRPAVQDDKLAAQSGPESEMSADTEFAALEHGAPLAHDMVFSANVTRAAGPAMATTEQMSQMTEVLAAMRMKAGRKPRRADLAPRPELLTTWRVHYNFYAPMAPEGKPQSFELALVAYDANGHMLNGALETVALDAAKPDGERRPVRCDLTVSAPKRATSLRVVVREAGTGRTGALEVPLPPDAPAQ